MVILGYLPKLKRVLGLPLELPFNTAESIDKV